MAADSDNTLLLLGLGGLAFYLWQKSEAERAAVGLSTLPTASQVTLPAPGSTMGTPIQPIATKTVDPLAATVGGVAASIVDTALPGAGAVVGVAAQAAVKEIQAILADPITPLHLAEIAFAPIAIPGKALLDMTGLSTLIWGHPLDNVNDILLSAFTSGNVSNDGGGGPIYAMDKYGRLWNIARDPSCSSPDPIWCAQYSWREIIAVDQSVINKFQVAGTINYRAQIEPMPRPLDPDLIRKIFGFDAIFKLGNSNTLYGPGQGASTPTLVGVHDGAPEGPGAVYQVMHPWEGGDYNLHQIGRSWKRHIGSPQALYNHGWSFSNVLWVDETDAARIPTFGPDLTS